AVQHGGGQREQVRLEEIPPDQRAPILKTCLRYAPGARAHMPVEKDAPLTEFERIAPAYPVFRVVSLAPERPSAQGRRWSVLALQQAATSPTTGLGQSGSRQWLARCT